MGETLMQRHRVGEEALRRVKPYQWGRKRTVPKEEAPAKYVPAAAVIRMEQALSGFTGCKGSVDGCISLE